YGKIPYEFCSPPAPGPHNPASDIAVSFASHEQAEMITDPDGGGWWGTNGNTDEIGDRCQGSGAFQHWNGHTYLMQLEWSNRSNACVAGEPASQAEIKPTS